jgi:hypothetical protein
MKATVALRRAVVCLFLAAATGLAALPLPARASSQSSLTQLPLAMQLQGSSIVSYFNQVARPTDIALVGQPNTTLLNSVTKGQGLVVYTSWAAALPTLPSLTAKAKLVGYDPEHWSQTPTSEQDNLVATVKQASTQVHGQHRSFFLAPDDQFDLQYAAQLAPYADYYCIQAEHQETNPSQFSSFVRSLASTIHGANPNAKVYVQVSTVRGSPQQILTALQSVQGAVNGYVIWSATNQLSLVQETVSLVRG